MRDLLNYFLLEKSIFSFQSSIIAFTKEAGQSSVDLRKSLLD